MKLQKPRNKKYVKIHMKTGSNMSTRKIEKLYKRVDKNAFGQNVGVMLAETFAMQFSSQDLLGESVRLINLANAVTQTADFERILDQIWQVVVSEPNSACWTYLPYEGFESKQSLKVAFSTQFGFSGSTHYLIEVNHQIVGWLAVMNIRPQHAVVEIGNIYFSHKMKRSRAATEAIFLLLSQCMKQGCRRIEWKCDDLNQASKQAALRLGFRFEGLFRQDRVTKGRNRNTAWFSILDEEWSALEPAYQAWLNADNFDGQGQQKIRLQDFKILYAEHTSD